MISSRNIVESPHAKIIKKAEGGVLFVDELYTLYFPSECDFGKKAVETIMANMNNNLNPNIKNHILTFAGLMMISIQCCYSPTSSKAVT